MVSRTRARLPLANKQWYDWNLPRRIAIVCSVLLGSALSALVPSRWILLMMLAGFGILALWQTPQLGIVALLPASMLVPAVLATQSETTVLITMLMIIGLFGLWLLKSLLGDRRITLGPTTVMAPLLVFVGIAMLSFGMGQLPWFAGARAAPLEAQLSGLAVFILSAAVFLVVANQVSDMRWLKILTWVYLATGALYLAGRLLPWLGRLVLPQFQSGATGSLFWTWLIALAASQALFNEQLRTAWRVALGAVVASALFIALGPSRSWASGWLPPLVALLVMLWVAKPRLALLVIAIGGVFILLDRQEFVGVLLVDEEYSTITRWEAWRIVVGMVETSPLLGFGPANYRFYTEGFPILGWRVQFNSHNQYVDLLAQTGLLGLAAFLWFAWVVGRFGWRMRSTAPTGFARAYVYGALGGLAGTLASGMLADWFLPFVYNITLAGMRSSIIAWVFLGALVGMDRAFGDNLLTSRERPAFLSIGASNE